MTLALVVVLCAGVVALAVLVSCRGRHHHPGDSWSAAVTSADRERGRLKQAMSPTTNGRRPL